MNNILPVDVLLDILSYVTLFDRLEYARCNRSLCRDLMVRLRIITIRKERIEYLSSESFRNKIQRLIVNPYEQLELPSNYPKNRIKLSERSLLGLNLVLRTLFLYMKDFPLLFPHIRQVQHLILQWEIGDKDGLIPPLSGLRQLSLICYPRSSLSSSFSSDDVPPLNQQLDLRSLRYLKLQSCPTLSDVTCLDHIFELHLISCHALVDISCLNHNKIIVIDSCCVRDYSQSFRCSQVITVVLSQSVFNYEIPTIKGINLDNLEAVQSLTLDFDHIRTPLSSSLRLPSSLRHLSLTSLDSKIVIPPDHNLKEIIFNGCDNFSFHNLQNIPFVTINSCRYVADWSPLQNNKNVVISSTETSYATFRSGKELNNVKKLTLIDRLLIGCEDLTNITHLKLNKFTSIEGVEHRSYIESLDQGKKLFSSAISLQEIEVKINFKPYDISLLHAIMQSPQHKRIIMSLRTADEGHFEELHQLIMKDFGWFYEVEVKHPKKLVLLKREEPKEKKKDEGGLLSFWRNISIFDYFKRR